MNVAFVVIPDSREAAMRRLLGKGWRRASISVNGATFAMAAKGYAAVAFHPTDPNLSSLPLMEGGGPFGAGFAPLDRNDPLYGEALDCLCDALEAR